MLDSMADTWARLNAGSVSGGPMPIDIVAYCVSAAHNREIDQHRRRESPLLSIEGTDAQPLAPPCQDPFRRSAVREILTRALERITLLPSLQREAIVRAALLGQSYREIALGLYGHPPSARTVESSHRVDPSCPGDPRPRLWGRLRPLARKTAICSQPSVDMTSSEPTDGKSRRP